MLALGIECTAHTFGVGIIDCSSKTILFNKKNLFKDPENGMDPRKLLEFHVAHFDEILLEAKEFLKTEKKSFQNIELISFSQGPGQGSSLKVAALVAKTLSLKYSIPVVGVNHIRSHLEIGKMLTGFDDPMFLNITGVNSQVVAKDENGLYKVYGETEDIGLGNLLDSCARLIGLGFPGGPKIEEIAKKGKNFIEIPYTLKGMNVGFAGLYSFVKQQVEKFEKTGKVRLDHNNEITYEKREDFIADLCFSLQETVFAMIMEVAERAIAYTNKKEMVLVGGVAANKRFTEMATQMCEIRKAKYESIPLSLCMDNGVMIAWIGFVERERASLEITNLKPKPYITVESEL